MIQRYVLNRPVVIEGPDFWGRRAKLTLHPIEQEGWYWRTREGDFTITPRLLQLRRNSIAFEGGGAELYIVEHLLALRFSGLDGVILETATPHLPYDGGGKIFWDAVAQHLVVPSGELKAYEPERTIQEIHPGARFMRRVAYSGLRGRPHLRLDVHIYYPGLGKESLEFTLPSLEAFEKLASVKSQGWPRWRYRVARVAGTLGWPHRHNVVWPQEMPDHEALRLFATHRAYDVLGALAAATPAGGYLVGHYESWQGGHAVDVDLVRQVYLREVTARQEVAA